MIMDQVHTAGDISARDDLKAANNFAHANGAKTYTVKGGTMEAKGLERPKPIRPRKVKNPK